MVFSSLTYLFAFLPLLLVCYYVLSPGRGVKNAVLLIFSLIFYAWGGLKLLPLLVGSIVMNWVFGLCAAQGRRWRRLALVLAVTGNVGILFVFKYLGFATEIASRFLPSVPVLEIVLPIGISFYTFQGLSYVLDVYMGNVDAPGSLSDVALYIALFPQLVAGPIVRYSTVCEELRHRRETLDDVYEGALRFFFGLAKKVLIANQVGALADSVFTQSHTLVSTSLAWLGVIAYTFQIYFDFSGYSDMAIGLGRVFGFHFLENFNYPYISRSVTEFWRRWHMSLGTWFRDYLYLPLGGNRVCRWKHVRNILVVWLLTGLWHGAAWTFILWGVYYGLLLLGEKFLWGRWLAKTPAPVRHGYTMLAVMLGWLVFRSPDLAEMTFFLKSMFTLAPGGFWSNQVTYLLHQYRWELMAACVLSLPVVPLLREKLRQRGGALADAVFYGAVPLLALALTVLCSVRLVSSGFNPFIYFQF